MARDWFALADPNHRGIADERCAISADDFFDFCSNRQHVVRRLLELLSTSEAIHDNTRDIDEAIITAINRVPAPRLSGGDEWLANPAWKKTAERMIPKDHVHINAKPTSQLLLDWVHGYRGYDCRNNVRYIDASGNGTQMFFHAAALGIAQCEQPVATAGDASRQGKEQVFFGEHSDDVISLAVHEGVSGAEHRLVATGEIGKHPAVYLYEWDTVAKRFSSLTSMRGFHTSGVCQLSFSKDAKSIFTVGADYTIAIYDSDRKSTKFSKMIASSQGPKDKVLHCASLNDGAFVSCGEKHIVYWTHTAGRIEQAMVKLEEHKRKLIMCVAPLSGLSGMYAAGTSEGDILLFVKDKLYTKAVYAKAHKKAVNAIWADPSGGLLLSGGSDGKVMVWEVKVDEKTHLVSLNLIQEFSVFGSNYSRLNPSAEASDLPPVRSVCLSGNKQKCLVGTQSCEILEFTLKTGRFGDRNKSLTEVVSKLVVCGHYKDELWGLGIRPLGKLNGKSDQQSRPEYCTVGDDGVLRIWDLLSRSQKSFMDMKAPARCCAYSPDGEYLAVGFGSSMEMKKNKHSGAVRIFRGDTLQQVCEMKEAKQSISAIKFSPDGSMLAVGARDNSIYLYSVAQQFKPKAKFAKHNAGILDFDFTVDGKYLQSTCSAYELLFSNSATGVQLTNGASFLADQTWATYTCTLGWPVIGIWSGAMDGSDVNSTDRSPSGKLIATGDDFGKVNCYKYPCTLPGGAPKSEYSGHSSHVTCVRWVNLSPSTKKPTDDYLISLGGEDKTVMQWRVVDAEVAEFAVSAPGAEVYSGNDVSSEKSLEEGPSGGDEFMAVKAWLGAIKAPSAWITPDASKKAPFYAAIGEMGTRHRMLRETVDKGKTLPLESRSLTSVLKTYADVKSAAASVMNRMSVSGETEASQPDGDELELEWVHGFSSSFAHRNEVFYVLSREKPGVRYLVYKAAGLGIVMEINEKLGTKQQHYFRGHTDDIMSMAMHENQSRSIVATGQIGCGETFVWDIPSIKTLSILKTGQKTITQLAFSKADDGRFLISIAADSSVCVSDWKSQSVLSKVSESSAASTYHVCASSAKNCFIFFTCGDKFVTIWNLNGRNLCSSKVSAAGIGRGTSGLKFLCCAEAKSIMLVGCENGLIYTCGIDSTKAKLVSSFSATKVPGVSKGEKDMSSASDSKNHVLSIKVDDTHNFLFAGSKDGSVSQFNTSNFTLTIAPELLRIFKVQAVFAGISACQIHAIDATGDRLLVGTLGSDLLEFALPQDVVALPVLVTSAHDADLGVVTRGHCYNELWGLATHPLLPEYCSCGDDMMLRTFSVTTKKMLSLTPLGIIARACDYNNDGSLIAVGFGGSIGHGKESKSGMIRLYRGNCSGTEANGKNFFSQNHFKTPTATSDPLAQAHDAKQWISVVRFSVDGHTLVAGSHDCKIYIYNVELVEDKSASLPAGLRVAKAASLSLRCTFRKHNSVINHLDLSVNGRYMQSNCSAYELLFCDTTTGQQISNPNELKDVTWDKWTCTLGWPVQGIWSNGMDGGDINSVARSSSGHLIAAADDFGKIRLFRYPCLTEHASCLSYSGHSSHVMNVSWTAADECLISVGGNDKCVMQWKHVMSESAPTGGIELKASDTEEYFGPESEDVTDLEPPSAGDESGAVKPWLGTIRTPKNAPVIDSSAPAVKVTLDWVHGYTSGICCNTRISQNLYYAYDGNIVFPAAALGVKFIKSDQSGKSQQNFFRGHTDDVLCLAISADRRFVASGQVASVKSNGKGSICVWDSQDCRELCRMEGCHQRAVVSLSFSPDGSQLLSVGQDNKYTHKLWSDIGGNWCRVQCTATAVSDQSTLFFSHWLKGEQSDCALVSGGAKNINFWKLEGATLVKKQGRFGRKYKQCSLLCVANLQTADEKGGASHWCVVAGTATGALFSFEDREITSGVENAHNGPVLCLVEGGKECKFLVSGGADAVVRIWNQALQPISSHDIKKLCLGNVGIGALDIRPAIDGYQSQNDDLSILLGTSSGDIIELVSSVSRSKDNEEKTVLDISTAQECVLLSSHSHGELWGLAVHPTDPDLFATVGDDASLRIWSIRKHKLLLHEKLPHPARTVAWTVLPTSDPTNADAAPRELIAVGFMEAEGLSSRGKSASKPKTNNDAGAIASRPAVQLYKAQLVKGNYEVKLLCSGSPTTAWVSALQFSPLYITQDGGKEVPATMRLGAGCHDKNLYLYDLPNPWADDVVPTEGDLAYSTVLDSPHYVYKKHSSAITNFDFSGDGTRFQSNCQAGELLYGAFVPDKVVDGKQNFSVIQKTSATEMAQFNGVRELDGDPNFWAQQTCTLGWAVQGIWPPGADTSDINSCDRSPNEDLLASADDFGLLKIFRYPAVKDGSKFLQYSGHSSHVTNVRWTIGEHLVTTGGNDNCVFVWHCERE